MWKLISKNPPEAGRRVLLCVLKDQGKFFYKNQSFDIVIGFLDCLGSYNSDGIAGTFKPVFWKEFLDSMPPFKHVCEGLLPSNIDEGGISWCREFDDGHLYIADRYGTFKVNNCPFCGHKALKQAN